MILKLGGVKLATQLRESWIADLLIMQFSAVRVRSEIAPAIFFVSTTVLRRGTGRFDVTSVGLVRAIERKFDDG